MRREDKVKAAQVDAAVREHQERYARYFAFLDGLPLKDASAGALVKEFGIDEGDAHGAYLHWMVSAVDGGTPMERAAGAGGM